MARYDGPAVDAHHHLWTWRHGANPWLDAPGNEGLAGDFGPEPYLTAMDGLDVRASVWIEALAADPLTEAIEAQAVSRRYPNLCTAIVAHAPLDAPDIEQRLEALRAAVPNLRGIRDIVAIQPGQKSFARRPDLLRSEAFAHGLSVMAARKLVLDLMLEPWQMPDACRLLERVPGLTVALEHGGSPDFSSPDGEAEWKTAMRLAACLPDLVVKVSALHCRMPGWTEARIGDAIEFLVDLFGPNRLAFASDFPAHDRFCPAGMAYEHFCAATADLTGAERHALFCGTASRVYGIGVS